MVIFSEKSPAKKSQPDRFDFCFARCFSPSFIGRMPSTLIALYWSGISIKALRAKVASGFVVLVMTWKDWQNFAQNRPKLAENRADFVKVDKVESCRTAVSAASHRIASSYSTARLLLPPCNFLFLLKIDKLSRNLLT